MMQKDRSYLLLIIAGAALLMIWAVIPASSSKQQQSGDEIARASLLLSQNDPDEALSIIDAHRETIDPTTQEGKKWLNLLIIAKEKQMDVDSLVSLYERFPQSFSTLESPSLLIAKKYISDGNIPEYQTVRNGWRGKEVMRASWILLDADLMLEEGRFHEVKELLEMTPMSGSQEREKQVRLAMLTQESSPKESWEHLSEALKLNPNDPNTRLWRAALLESAGKTDIAHSEYLKAVEIDRENPYLQDQLATFYVRQKEFDKALSVWERALQKANLPFLWTEILFWEKVAQDSRIERQIPDGEMTLYHHYLASLPDGKFWDQDAFRDISNHTLIQEEESTAFWLQTLDALQKGAREKAWNYLLMNPFPMQSLDPELQLALVRILQYQIEGTDQLPPHYPQELMQNEGRHPLFVMLEQKEAFRSQEAEELLNSNIAYPVALLASGWKKGAYYLFEKQVLSEKMPDFVALELTALIEEMEGELAAVQFAEMQPPHPKLSRYLADYYLARGDEVSGLRHLLVLAQKKDLEGELATKKAVQLLIKNQEFDMAKAAVLGQPRLAKNEEGTALLARLAVYQEDIPLADKLYRSIRDSSSEARSYLAKKAFAEKDWKTAKELTEQLLQEHPESAVLKRNLIKINEKTSRRSF